MSQGRTWTSSIGMKTVMAVTGLALVLFLIAHMLGNLQVFLGPEPLNRYAAFLQGLGELLWGMRIGLLVLFVVHVYAAIAVTLGNRRARPSRYAHEATVQVGIASRTLIWTGLVVLAFLIYHLLHFTLGVTNPQHFAMHDAQGRHDVYAMVVLGFSQWPITVAYVVANLLLGFHLFHAVPSLFQTLGWNDPKWSGGLRRVGIAVALVVAGGNIAMPLAVLGGLIRLGTGGHG
jgi:succinate dehydrogenase / fumarate reductase cytochrome b subunit